jgi:hypothetical protein
VNASTAPMPQDLDGLRAQNRAYRSLCASLEASQAIQTEQGRKYQEAITTLDSEREANARLTEELERTARNRDMWKSQCERQADELHCLRNEYICKCGVRVEPHRCRTGSEF